MALSPVSFTMPKTDSLQTRAASIINMPMPFEGSEEDLALIGRKIVEVWCMLRQQLDPQNFPAPGPINFHSIMLSVEEEVLCQQDLHNVPVEMRSHFFQTNKEAGSKLFQTFLKVISRCFQVVQLPGESLTVSMMLLEAMQARYKLLEDEALETIWHQKLVNLPGFNQAPYVQNAQSVRAWLNNPENAGPVANVHSLDLSSLGLKTVPREIELFSQLEGLDLSKNQIRVITDSIGNLLQLRRLFLGCNLISVIPDSIGNLLQLRSLFLEGNQITIVPDSISNLQWLQVLRLDNNQISVIPDSIGNLERLELFWLSNNRISALPHSIGNLQQLRALFLENNNISAISDSISHFCRQRDVRLLLDGNSCSFKSDNKLKDFVMVLLYQAFIMLIAKSLVDSVWYQDNLDS